MSVRVKVCGVTRVEDARHAWACGADALGLNFWPQSPRHVGAALARNLAATRPAFGAVVGVFVNADPAEVRALVREVGLTAVQLHGDEPPEACAGYGVPVIKALRVSGPADVERARAYAGAGDVTTLLLDGAAAAYGGGGVGFDWALCAPLVETGVPLVVAGGLNPGNVAAAVLQVRPAGVDVASGVERAPGLKDPDAVRAFVRAAKLAGLAPASPSPLPFGVTP